MEKILKKIVIGGLFVLPFLPLVVTSSLFFPYISGKNFGFRIIMELVFFAWVCLAFMKEEYRPKWNWLLGAVSIFTVVIFFADIFSIYPYKSFWSNFERMEGFVTIIHLWMYFVVITSMFTKELWNKFINTWLVSSVIISVYALFQVMGALEIHQSGTRVDASFGNATYLAVFALFNIFFCFYQYIRTESKNFKILYGILSAVLMFVLYSTATRGAILGFLGGVILMAILIAFTVKDNPRVRKISYIALGGVFALVVLFFAFKNTSIVRQSPVLGRFASISFEETTTKSRFLVWNMAMQGAKERPILGWGQESFNYVFNKYYNPQMYAQEQWFDRTHNVISDWLIAGGILGLLAYLSILFFGFYYIWKSNLTNTEKSILTGLFAGYFFQNLFVFDQIISYLLFFSLLGYIHHMSATKSIWQKEYDPGFITRIVAPGMAVAFVFVFYFVNVGAILQAKTFVKALNPQQGKYEENYILFKKALAYEKFGTTEVREHLMETANQIRVSGAPVALKGEFFDLAKSELDKQIAETPQNARYYVFAGSLMTNFDKPEEALNYFKEAVKYSPNKQTIHFGLGMSYLALDKTAEAEDAFKTAYTLAENNDGARIVYALGLIYNKKGQEGIDLLVEKFGEVPNDPRIIKAFFDIKDYASALKYAKQAAEREGATADNFISLASVYSELGQYQKAIEAIRKVIELQPSFKDQGEYYIKQLEQGKKP